MLAVWLSGNGVVHIDEVTLFMPLQELQFWQIYNYRQDLPEGQLCQYFVYSRADFEVFHPAGATRCTDQGQIWQGGADRRSAPSCQIWPWSVQGWGLRPQNWKKIWILPI